MPVVSEDFGVISEHPMDSDIRWDANEQMYLLDPGWVKGRPDPLPHMWLDECSRVTVQDLLQEVLDPDGRYALPLPAALTKTAFEQRMEYNPELRWRDLTRWQAQYRFSTALVRLANRRGCPILLFSPTVPHRRSWSPDRKFWRSAWLEWNRSSRRITDAVGGGSQVKFSEWTASFSNGVHRGHHILILLSAEVAADEVEQLRNDLAALWVKIVRRNLDRFGAPDSIPLIPEHCAHIKEFVDEQGRSRTDTSYFWKDQQMHRDPDRYPDPDDTPPRGSRRNRRFRSRSGHSRGGPARPESFGVKDLEQMAHRGDRAASLLLDEVHGEMKHAERMTLGDRKSMEPMLLAFTDVIDERFAARLRAENNNAVSLTSYRQQREERGAAAGAVNIVVQELDSLPTVSGGDGAFQIHLPQERRGEQLQDAAATGEHRGKQSAGGHRGDRRVQASDRIQEQARNGEHRDAVIEEQRSAHFQEMYLEWPMHRTKSAGAREDNLLPFSRSSERKTRIPNAERAVQRAQGAHGAPIGLGRVVVLPVDSCGAQNRSESFKGSAL